MMLSIPNLGFNIAFIGLKILFFIGILKQIKTGHKKLAIFQIILYFLFDFICISFFYSLNLYR